MDTLAWRRKAQWTYYPEDHIGRPEGRAKAFPGTPVCKDSPFYRTRPSWAWSQDCNPLGSNDFRSTKHNIYEASLTGARRPHSAERACASFPTARQHVRAWVEDQRTRLLVADVSCEGSSVAIFPRAHSAQPEVQAGRPRDRRRAAVRHSEVAEPPRSQPQPPMPAPSGNGSNSGPTSTSKPATWRFAPKSSSITRPRRRGRWWCRSMAAR